MFERTSKNNILKIRALLYAAAFFCGSVAFASGITYHGRLLNPDSTPVTDSSVQFKMDILTPDSQSCLMYEELQTKNLSSTSGAFAITINDGTGTRTDSSGYTFDQVFGNIGTLTFVPATCSSGTGSYTPATGDGRTFQVYFKTSTMSSWEPMPAQSINFSPFAIEAKQVSGFPAASLLRVQQASGAPGTATPLSPTDFSNLQTLLAGTSTQYVQSGTNGAPIPSMSSNPGTPSAGDIWFNSTSKTLDYYDGTAVQTVGTGSGAGTVTSVATGTGLTGGPITSSGTISLATVGTAGTYTKVTTDAYGRVTAGTQITGNDITSGTIGGTTAINTSGNIQTSADVTSRRDFLYDHSGAGPGYVGFQAPATVTADYTLTWPAVPAASNGQILVSDTSGNLSWSSPTSGTVTNIATGTGLTGGPISGSGTISLANPTLASIGGVEAINPVAHEWINSISTSGVPALSQPAFSDISGTVNLTSQVTGVLPVANGGTGASSLSGAGVYLNGGNSFGAAATLGTNDANTLGFKTNGTTQMTIDTAGNVGIGTTSPLSLLHVQGNSYITGALTVLNTIDDQTDNPGTYSSSSSSVSAPVGVSLTMENNDSTQSSDFNGLTVSPRNTSNTFQHAFFGAISNSSGSTPTIVIGQQTGATAYQERMRIDQNGYVGIGTTSPQGPLDVEGGTAAPANNGLDLILSGQAGGGSGGNNGGNIQLNPGLGVNPGVVEIGQNTNVGRMMIGPDTSAYVSGYGNQAIFGQNLLLDNYNGIRTWAPSAAGTVGYSGVYANAGTLSFFTSNAATSSYGGVTPTAQLFIASSGDVGIGTTSPTAALQLKAGVATAGGAPLKLTAGTSLTTPEPGAIEYDGSSLYYTDSSSVRHTLAAAGSGITALTGDVTASGSGSVTATVNKVNGVAYSASPTTNTVPVVTGSNTVTYEAVPNAALQNSSVTLGSTAVSLGSTASSLAGLTSVGLGVDGTTAGSLSISKGSGGASVTLQNNAATVAYNFNLPATAGTAGQVLTSQGGGTSAMTWTTPASGTVTNVATGTGLIGGPITSTGTISLAPPSATTIGGVEAVGQTAHEWVQYIDTTGVPHLAQPDFSDLTGASNVFLNGGNSFGAAASLGTNDANTLSLKTNNTTRMTFDTAGNVGIGTTTPGQLLDVETSQNQTAGLLVRNNNSNNNAAGAINVQGDQTSLASIIMGSTTNATWANRAVFQSYGGTGTGITLDADQAGADIRMNTAGSERLRILANGNVGIGTTTPTTKLQVVGGIYSQSGPVTLDDGEQLQLGSGNAIYGFTNSYMVFQVNSAERMRIDPSGNVGIGTTSPTAALQLKAGVATAGGAPLKLTAGTSLTTPEPGAIEYDGTSLFYTDSSSVRHTLAAAGAGITALTGDVSASGSGSVAATVNSVGGSTAANVHTAEVAANAATNANTASTIVKRDASGSFSAGAVSVGSSIFRDNGANTVTLEAPTTVTSYVLKLPASQGASGTVLTEDGSGNLSWLVPTVTGATLASGDIWVGNGSNVAAAVAMSGDATLASSGTLTLAPSGVTAATYGSATQVPQIAVDAKGRITAASNVSIPTATAGQLGLMEVGTGLSVASGVVSVASTGATGAFLNGGNSFGQAATLGTNDAYTLGFMTNGSTRVTIDTAGNFGIGTASPGFNLSFNGQSAQTIGMARETTAATAGNPLTISSGGAVSGGTDLAGGDLSLASGMSTGQGGSNINFLVAPGAQGTGTTDRSAVAFGQISGANRSFYFGENSAATGFRSAALGYGVNVTGTYSIGMNLSSSPVSVSQSNVMAIMGGNVGIGTTSPSLPLQVVAGNVNAFSASSNLGTAILGDSMSGGGPAIWGGSGSAAGIIGVRGDSVNVQGVYGVSNGGYGVQGQANTGVGGYFSSTSGYGLIVSSGDVGIGTTSPTAALQLKAGVATAGGAPLKLTAGTSLSTPEPGAIEYDGTSLFYTDSSSVRHTLAAAGAGITALTGDVTASGSGSVAATLATTGVTAATYGSATQVPQIAVDAKGRITSASNVSIPTATTGQLGLMEVGTGLNVAAGVVSVASTGATGAYLNGGNSFGQAATLGTNDAYPLSFKTNNASRMTIDTSGNVGIGTATPGGTLDVEGGAASTNGVPITLAAQSASSTYNGGNIVLLPGAATGTGQPGRLVVGSTTPHWFANILMDVVGNASNPSSRIVSEQRGAGASAGYPGFMAMNYMDTAATGEPQILLQNARGTYASPAAIQSGDSLGDLIYTGTYDTSGNPAVGANIAAVAEQNWSATANGAALTFSTTTYNTTSQAEAMRITSNGDVAIGTTSASEQLVVVGAADGTGAGHIIVQNTLSTGNAAGYLQVASDAPGIATYFGQTSSAWSGSGVGWTGVPAGAGYVGTEGTALSFASANTNHTGYINFMTGGGTTANERMRIDQNGNVGIGTTSPTAALQLRAGVATAGGAPLKLTAGTNLTTPEPGAVEFDGTSLYYTDSSSARHALAAAGADLSLAGGTMTGQLDGADGSAASPGFSFSGDTGTGFYDAGSHTIGVSTNGTESMILSSTGITGSAAMTVAAGGSSNLTLSGGTGGNVILSPNVGIGTTSPKAALDVSGAIDIAGVNAVSFPPDSSGSGGSIAIGPSALAEQSSLASTAFANTAIGYKVMSSSGMTTAAVGNTAVGYLALESNTSGNNNVALGNLALIANLSGNENVALGGDSITSGVLATNTTGNQNTGVGADALAYANASGNTAIGYKAGFGIGTGGNNTLLGYEVGMTTLTTGTGNILIGTSSSVDAPSNSTSNFLNLGNVIFATGMTGTVSSPAGHVGIGTTSPASSLDVNGSILAEGANSFNTQVANATTTGTTINKLAKLSSGKAVEITTTDSTGILGIVAGGAGTSGSAQIAVSGQALCAFDGATTQGDYVAASTSTAGDCTDAGATYPTGGQILGRVLSTNASAGTYAVLLYGSEVRGPGTAINLNAYDSTAYASTSAVSDIPADGGEPYLDLINNTNGDGEFSILYGQVSNTAGAGQTSYIATVAATGASTYSPVIAFGQSTGVNAYAERMRIDQNGYVGIGTTTPTTALTVNGDTTTYRFLSASGTPQSPTNPTFSFSVDQNSGMFSSGWGTLSFGTNSTERIRIISNGYVGIGSTTPGYPLDVAGDINTSTCIHYSGGSSGTCSSDERLKKDIKPYNLGLKELIGIDPVTYKYNGLGGLPDDGRTQLGVIAQQVEKVAPQIVGTKELKLHPDDKTPTLTKTVNYSSFTYMLINAVKSLYHRVVGIEKHQSITDRDVASLKAENAELKAENVQFKKDNAQKTKELEEIKARLDRIEKALQSK